MKKFLTLVALCIAGSALAAFAADGKATWEDNCKNCHGPDGKGDTKMGHKLHIPDLSNATVQAGFTDEQAVSAVKNGVKDKDGRLRMKAIDGLSDDDIKAVVQFVRGLKS
jgi:mono/diheme cytochrome c family protein